MLIKSTPTQIMLMKELEGRLRAGSTDFREWTGMSESVDNGNVDGEWGNN